MHAGLSMDDGRSNRRKSSMKLGSSRVALYQASQGILCVFGVVISAFALFVEKSKHEDSSYVALCDLNSWMSCSNVLTSQYSTGFGVVAPILGEESFLNMPNSIYGIVFFTLQFALGLFHNVKVLKLLLQLSVVSILMVIYLASILIFVLKDLCIVCVSTYVINVLLLFFNYKVYKFYSVIAKKKSK